LDCSKKTTIDLPDDVLSKAKIVAASRGMTLRELVAEGLRLVTDTLPAEERQQREAELRDLLKTMRASNTEAMVLLTREKVQER
jgi:KaiC/GvpD/RAD55 family RecA-like ATPase